LATASRGSLYVSRSGLWIIANEVPINPELIYFPGFSWQCAKIVVWRVELGEKCRCYRWVCVWMCVLVSVSRHQHYSIFIANRSFGNVENSKYLGTKIAI
jgi:hypothetical protein